MTAAERKWKPGDIFPLAVPKGNPPADAKILRLVTICGVAEFALHRDRYESPTEWRVSHIATGVRVSWGDSPKAALLSAHARARAKGGAPAIRAAVERHK